MTCPHTPTTLTVGPTQSVHRDECTLCFDTPDSPDGLNLCLTCFNGGCEKHAKLHAQKTGHGVVLNIKRSLKPQPEKPKRGDEEPPAKITKLSIPNEQSDEEKYDTSLSLRCFTCPSPTPFPIPPALQQSINTLLTKPTHAQATTLQAWELDIQPCPHTLSLSHPPQGSIAPVPPSGHAAAHCASCSLTSNLWMCLTCGALGCGRAQFGGIQGNGHAQAHATANPAHHLAVKLGTLTPHTPADTYCYTCGDSVLLGLPSLSNQLASFGIKLELLEKTAESTTELNIAQNLSYDFSLTSSSGGALVPLYGPGLTGLKNLGNTCYMASVLQVLFSLPAFQARYFTPEAGHIEGCTIQDPTQCLECQLSKLADGLLSGRYSAPSAPPLASTSETEKPQDQHQTGIPPTHLRTLVGGLIQRFDSTSEFLSARQQDAEEFLGRFVSVLRREGKKGGMQEDPTSQFTHTTSQRLQCLACHGVRYRTDVQDVLSVSVPVRERVKQGVETKKVIEGGDKSKNEGDEGGKVESNKDNDMIVDVDPLDPSIGGGGGAPGQGSQKPGPRADDPLSPGVFGVIKPRDKPVVAPSAPDPQTKAEEPKKEYEPVELKECISAVLAPEVVEDYECSGCKKRGGGVKQTKFASLPDVLIVHAKKFQLINWVPAKLDIPLILPRSQTLTFTADQFSTGLQPGEVALPDENPSASSSGAGTSNAPTALPEFNPVALSTLETMGFPLVRCQKALLATGNQDAEAAMEWLFAHMDDADIDAPIQLGGSGESGGGAGAQVDQGVVSMLVDMGFTDKQATKALRETQGNPERAVEWLFSHPDDTGDDPASSTAASTSDTTSQPTIPPGHTSTPARYTLFAFISHKGPSMHSGHYVAHIRKGGAGKEGGEWVLFNDEKVVLAEGGKVGVDGEDLGESEPAGSVVAEKLEGEAEDEKEKDGDSVDELMKKAYLYFWVRN